jgi:hypothetical protein
MTFLSKKIDIEIITPQNIKKLTRVTILFAQNCIIEQLLFDYRQFFHVKLGIFSEFNSDNLQQ